MDHWSSILRRIILPAGDAAFGHGMMERYRFLRTAEWWPRERLSAYRAVALRQLVQVAYHEVPFYKDLMDGARVKPEDIREPRDLTKLPVVTKEMLRSRYPHSTTRATGLRTYEARSSGSTGTNFCVTEDARTAGHQRACLLLALEWAGWQIGHPHLQTGMTLNRTLDRKLKDLFLRCYYISAFDLTDGQLDVSLNLLEKHKIEHLWGYPGSLYVLSLQAKKRGWNRKLKSVVTWGDNLYIPYRRSIENAFKTRVSDTYGCGEGIQVAAQCGEGLNYHVHMLDVVVEYLDCDGNPVTPGTPGNLILTRLHPGPMPLIRYQVGDIGIASDLAPCACGRGFEEMKAIEGRDTDIVLTPSGNRLIVHFFTGVLEHFSEIQSFQVIQEEIGSIVIRVVVLETFSSKTAGDLIALLQERGADLEITVQRVSSIPVPSSGKRRFVMSKVAQPLLARETFKSFHLPVSLQGPDPDFTVL